MEQLKKYELLKDDTIKVTISNYVISKDNPNELVKIGDVDDIDGKRVLSYEVELYRIRALIDFGDVKKGDLGGYIQREGNLSHERNAWVYDEAKVYGSAKVYGNAMVYGHAEVKGNAEVYGIAKVFGNALVCDHVKVYGFGAICDRAEVTKDAEVTKSLDCIFFRSDWEKARWNKEIQVIDNLVGDCLTYTHSNQKWHIGRFYGSGEELIAEAYKKDQQTGDWFKAHVEFVKTLHNIKEHYADGEVIEKQ